MPRASDSPRYRASDSAGLLTWASDPEGPNAWASDPTEGGDAGWPQVAGAATDSPPNPATDPAPEWDAQAWGANDRLSTLSTAIGLAAALDAFCAAKAAEGLSPRTIVWYRMIGERLARRFGPERPVDALTPPELRTWLVELRASLSPMSVAGYTGAGERRVTWDASGDRPAASRGARRRRGEVRVPRRTCPPAGRRLSRGRWPAPAEMLEPPSQAAHEAWQAGRTIQCRRSGPCSCHQAANLPKSS